MHASTPLNAMGELLSEQTYLGLRRTKTKQKEIQTPTKENRPLRGRSCDFRAEEKPHAALEHQIGTRATCGQTAQALAVPALRTGSPFRVAWGGAGSIMAAAVQPQQGRVSLKEQRYDRQLRSGVGALL